MFQIATNTRRPQDHMVVMIWTLASQSSLMDILDPGQLRAWDFNSDRQLQQYQLHGYLLLVVKESAHGHPQRCWGPRRGGSPVLMMAAVPKPRVTDHTEWMARLHLRRSGVGLKHLQQVRPEPSDTTARTVATSP